MAKPNKVEKVEEMSESESVEDILSEIKNVISGEKQAEIEPEESLDASADEGGDDILDLDDVIELTEIANDDSAMSEEVIEVENQEEPVLEAAREDISGEEALEEDAEEDEFIDVLEEIDNSLSENETIAENQPDVENQDVEAQESEETIEEILDFKDDSKDLDGVEMAEQVNEADIDNMLEGAEEEPLDIDAMMQEQTTEHQAEVDAVEEPVSEPVVESSEEAADTNDKIKQAMADSKEGKGAQIEEVVNEDSTSAEDLQSKEDLISQESVAKSSAAIKGLINSIPKPQIDSPEFRSGVSVEDLVRESLSPMLKDWLDDNLEVIVKDIVQKEIKKILPRD